MTDPAFEDRRLPPRPSGGDLVVEALTGVVVGPIDLVVPVGTCAAITGPSGAGKSLLLRMIADLEPNAGRVRLGELCRETTPVHLWRRQVIHIAAEAGWWAETAAQHMPSEALPEALALALRLGIAKADLDRQIRTLSTGERQRLGLVRALVRRPRALLLDEPTSALDPTSVARVEDVLRERRADGMTLVVVSHDGDQARRLDAVSYAMTSGRLSPA